MELLHREQNPAFQRDIIDPSERTCTNHRYLMRQH